MRKNLTTNVFENIQSTVWQTVRFKPPPLNTSTIGWRVEFRPMEVQVLPSFSISNSLKSHHFFFPLYLTSSFQWLQFTDFENAAFATFVVLLTRVISTFNINLYIPISKVHKIFNSNYFRNLLFIDVYILFPCRRKRTWNEHRNEMQYSQSASFSEQTSPLV